MPTEPIWKLNAIRVCSSLGDNEEEAKKLASIAGLSCEMGVPIIKLLAMQREISIEKSLSRIVACQFLVNLFMPDYQPEIGLGLPEIGFRMDIPEIKTDNEKLRFIIGQIFTNPDDANSVFTAAIMFFEKGVPVTDFFDAESDLMTRGTPEDADFVGRKLEAVQMVAQKFSDSVLSPHVAYDSMTSIAGEV